MKSKRTRRREKKGRGKKPDCFGFYDDGDKECDDVCGWSDECFETGVI